MSAINGELSYEELLKIRTDNVSYASDASLRKVQLFIDATEAMLGMPISETQHAGEVTRLEPAILERSLERARLWQSAQRVATQPLPVFQPATCWRDE